MRPITRSTCVCVLLMASCAPSWERVDAQPPGVTLCDLYQHPEQYAGKMVKVRGSIAGNDMWIDIFAEKPCTSWMRVVLVFPKQLRPPPDFDLVRDDSFKEFEDAMYRPRPIRIEATFEGRFDSVVTVQDGKRTRVGKGYGKKHDYDGRIVLRQVSDVVAKLLPSK